MGQNFNGCNAYAATKPDAEWIGGNLAAGADHKAAAREFQAVASQNPSCKKPVAHYSLSAAPGEKLSNEQWRAAAEQHVNNMGHADHQWTAWRHHDREHDHVHIVVNRVHPVSLRVSTDSKDYERIQKSCRDLEKKHGLQQVQNGRDRLTEKIKAGQLGSEADPLRDQIRAAKAGSKSFEQFRERLAAKGITAELNQSKTTGHISGIVYVDTSGKRIKGSQLGKEFSSAGIHKNFEKETWHNSKQNHHKNHNDQVKYGHKNQNLSHQQTGNKLAGAAKEVGRDIGQAAAGKSMPGKDLGLGKLKAAGKILKLGKAFEL